MVNRWLLQLSGLNESHMRDIEKPIKERINEIIDIVASSNDHTILLIDEVPTVNQQDWSDLRAAVHMTSALRRREGGYP